MFTPERAEFHRLMLLQGLDECYTSELDALLLQESPLDPATLELISCQSDVHATTCALAAFIRERPFDGETVGDMIVEDLHRRYACGRMTMEATLETLAAFTRVCDYLDRLRLPWDVFDYVDVGICDRAEFTRQFQHWLYHKGRVGVNGYPWYE